MSLVQALILVVLVTATVVTVCAFFVRSISGRPSIRERQLEEEVSQ